MQHPRGRSVRNPGHHRVPSRAWALLVLCAAAVGCASPTGVSLGSMVVSGQPRPQGENEEALVGYYQTIFQRMRDAARGGTADDLKELRYLLRLHKKEGMVAFAREQMDRFELLADGLAFELELPTLCTLEPVVAGGHAHQDRSFRFRVRGFSDGRELTLGGGGAAGVHFQVVIKLRDFFADGQFQETTDHLPLDVEETHRLVDGAILERTFDVPAASARTAIRELWIAVEMLPGVVEVDGRSLPVSQIGRPRLRRSEIAKLAGANQLKRGTAGYTRCGTFSNLFYPEGVERIQEKPLETLMQAMRRGDSKWFRHVFLATHFLPESDREKAMSRLMDWVRNGTASQQAVATGSLRLIVDDPGGARGSLAGRTAWLVWWDSRSTRRR